MSRWLAVLAAACVTASCGVTRPSADDLRNDPHGHLVWAARTGDVAAIRSLAASGVDLDASPATSMKFIFPDFDHLHWTALQHAAIKQQVEAVRVLLEWGADPDANGATVLLIAAGSPDPTMMRLLLDAGADVNRTMATEAWAEVNEGKYGNPLGHLVAHVLGLGGGPSPKDVRARFLAIAAPSQP